MNFSNLEKNSQVKDECLQLIEQAFNYSAPYKFEKDFAQLVHPQNLKNCFFVEENNEVKATLFTLPKKLVYKSWTLDTLFIGGISVRESERGAGLFRSMLETLFLLNPDVSLFFLWSDLSNLYEKFSFHEFGLIKESTPSVSNNSHYQDFIPHDRAQFLKENYSQMKSQFLIPERDAVAWDILLHSPSIQFKIDQNKNIYFLNKGMDLQGICHEKHPFNAPSMEGAVNWDFGHLNSNASISRYMGFLRLGNLEKLSEFLEKTSQTRLKIIGEKDQLIQVEFDQELYEMTARDFIQGVWGPGKIYEWEGLCPDIIIYGYDSV